MERHRTSVTSPHATGRVRAGGRQPENVIDLGTALDLLAAAVRQRGADFVYRPVWVDEHRYLTCMYAHRGAPDCIVGYALAQAGVSVRALEAMRDDGVEELYLEGRFPVDVTLGALAVLRAAQQSQDRGCCWGDVLAQANAVAIRLLDLVPEPAAQPPAALTATAPEPGPSGGFPRMSGCGSRYPSG
jgi:hypothetical protein